MVYIRFVYCVKFKFTRAAARGVKLTKDLSQGFGWDLTGSALTFWSSVSDHLFL